ncbi:MAG: hypothetical protein RR778_09865 [Glutamicibacter sp.]|uniref:hypothetical protein n=1 Tax=Bacteria TaxID=2 RepID=UPI002FC820BA
MIDGLGFSGPDAVVETAGHRERVFTLDLGHAWVMTSMLDFKQTLGLQADDYDFLHALAQGLVLAYAGRTDNRTDVRYVAVTTPEALVQAGVSYLDDETLKLDGKIILAEVAIPARRG